MIVPRNPELTAFLRDRYDPDSLLKLRLILRDKDTLRFPCLATGLFSAALTTDYSRGTNYHAAWVRDNVHIAYAHLAHGHAEAAVRVARGLAAFFATQRPRFERIIDDPSLKDQVMQRPHVRFDGDNLASLAQPWAHAQNDALGYFLWLYAGLLGRQLLAPREDDVRLLKLFCAYLGAIEYWRDADSGHWEEARKVNASSVGAVVAGLEQLQSCYKRGLLPDLGVEGLVEAGRHTLRCTLPAESVGPPAERARRYDAALLFLIYPLAVVDAEMADVIADQTNKQLRGPIGIKRYLGDSFYCTDYESLMSMRNEDPTADFSDDIGARDALLRPDEEAQWCLFDPILSVHYGQCYRRTGDGADLARQTEHFNRALGQLTVADPPRCEAWRCPELYYTEHGRLQTSRSTPLLWTQANLWTALELMATNASLADGRP